MQFHRSKKGRCLDMSQTGQVVVTVCAASALALILLLVLGFARGPCGPEDSLCTLRQSLYNSRVSPVSESSSIPSKEEKNCVSGTACETSGPVVQQQPAAEMCYVREWELPSVVNEREYEKMDDENFPVVHRTFKPLGVSAFLFVQFGAYRGSPNNFSVIGLSPRSFHIYGNPGFECFWIPKVGGDPIRGNVTTFLPWILYTEQYTSTVIYCQFEDDVGTDGTGGSLKVIANTGSQDSTGLPSVHFTALTENEGEYESALFEEPLKYDHVYCGSPIFGKISPQRVREWLAYHARLFGPRSHFIFYDAGGLHDDLRKVLLPWVKLGRVSVMNYRQEQRYDTNYHSQGVAINDCLMQAKRIAEYAFFFDIDEYLYVVPPLTLSELMRQIIDERGRMAQQVTFDQRPMNLDHCVKRPENDSDERFRSLWGIEKLVFQRTEVIENRGWLDHKYAIQTRYILAAGVHDHELSYVPDGMGLRDTISYQGCHACLEDKLHYYHFHDTLPIREELCKVFVEPWVRQTKFDKVDHVYENSLASLADAVKQYELETVGPQPFIL